MATLNSQFDSLYDRTYKCPVCEATFKNIYVKTGKSRLIGKDTDLMPRYSGINPLLYDVVICSSCGYSALMKFFDKIKPTQSQLIIEKITPKYRPRIYPEVYDIDIAIERHKIALLNTITKNSKSSEEALNCLKLAWLFRIKEDKVSEDKFLAQALLKFKEAYGKESPPLAGMDAHTISYLIGELARRLGRKDEALNWLGRVILGQGVNPRLKELARDQKDLIKTQ